MWYVLDENRGPVPEPDAKKQRPWHSNIDNRRVGKTELPDGGYVSTVFLGADHGWGGGPPVLFETMLFRDGPDDNWCRRYHTWAEAEAGHNEVVAALREGRSLDELPEGA